MSGKTPGARRRAVPDQTQEVPPQGQHGRSPRPARGARRRRKATSSVGAGEAFEGVSYVAGIFGTPLVLVFAYAAALFDKNGWVVLLVGYLGLVVGAVVAGGIGVVLSRTIGWRETAIWETAVFGFPIVVGIAVCVTAMVVAWMNWA